MLIGFTGHRDWLCDHQSLLRIEQRYPGATWVHGGAEGFDTQVNDVALLLGKELGLTLRVVRPDYMLYHPKQAPLMRNMVIVNMVSLLVACYDGRKTGGTHQCINYAKGKVPVEYVTPVTRVKVPLKV